MNKYLEGIPELPASTQAKLNEIEPPKWHWFFRKRAKSGEYDKFGQPKQYPAFACTEEEASRKDENKYEQIGASDGTTYFEYMRTHLQPNMVYDAQKAVQVERDAFNAELEKAKGHYRRPRKRDRYFMSASEGTTGIEEFKRSWQ